MEFRNTGFLKREEKDKILQFVKSTCKEYDVSMKEIKGLELNNQLRVKSGYILYFFKRDYSAPYHSVREYNLVNIKPGNIKQVWIHFSLRLYKEFGFETLLSTVAHELAHYISLQKFGEGGHGLKFKEVCAAIGGHMNKKIAGQDFKEFATDKFCVTKKNYRYTCQCRTWETVRPYAERTLNRYYCPFCKTFREDMKMERI